MVSLMRISDYIDQTAKIIGGVLELDVLIVDSTLRILGDSDLASISKNQCIRNDSILARVMVEERMMTLNSKQENAGCSTCKLNDSCIVSMIIGIPLFYDGRIIGSLGVIANSEQDKEKMMSNQENYNRFIDRMIELIINKLRKVQEFEEISILKKRMEVVLDSNDYFLILVSNEGIILQNNVNFKHIFKKNVPTNISEFLDAELVYKILHGGKEIKYHEVMINKKHDFLLGSKPVILDQKDHGAVLTFRSLKAIAEEMNELYTPSMEVEFDDLIGNSPEITAIKDKIRQISGSASTVLIDGETGTGKEVVARLIHNTSKRKNKPFVAINCSAIPEELMESELFGYEEGAFSGARKGGKIGKFHLAEGGTIFLDEIGEMSLHLQAKLLRVLQEKNITKIGGLESSDIDVRIISATNRKLEELVHANKFREDLYYRLKVIPITIPPLRERKADLAVLINHFLKLYAKILDKQIDGISDDVLMILLNNPWRGNVRELKNVIEFLINMTNNSIVTMSDLPSDLLGIEHKGADQLNIEHNTKKSIEEGLKRFGHNTQAKERIADSLGISLATLYRKIKEFGL